MTRAIRIPTVSPLEATLAAAPPLPAAATAIPLEAVRAVITASMDTSTAIAPVSHEIWGFLRQTGSLATDPPLLLTTLANLDAIPTLGKYVADLSALLSTPCGPPLSGVAVREVVGGGAVTGRVLRLHVT